MATVGNKKDIDDQINNIAGTTSNRFQREEVFVLNSKTTYLTLQLPYSLLVAR